MIGSKCKVCAVPSNGAVFCSDACEELHKRLSGKNLRNRATLPAPEAVEDDEPEAGWGVDASRLDPPEPCVLYGLLTFADVQELRRRRAKLEAGRPAEMVL